MSTLHLHGLPGPKNALAPMKFLATISGDSVPDAVKNAGKWIQERPQLREEYTLVFVYHPAEGGAWECTFTFDRPIQEQVDSYLDLLKNSPSA